jgi:hypothetical protein
MPKLLLLILAMAFGRVVDGQGWDMVLLKKNGKTLINYMPGAHIAFHTTDGQEADGIIRKIERDSIFLTYFDVRQGYTPWYTTVLDTVSAYLMSYDYRTIDRIHRKPAGFEFIRNGSLFMIGGTAYALLHVINAAYLKQPVDGRSLAIAGAFVAGGYLMKRLRKHHYPIGGRYKLEYIRVSGK